MFLEIKDLKKSFGTEENRTEEIGLDLRQKEGND